jgi:hypothetical protein
MALGLLIGLLHGAVAMVLTGWALARAPMPSCATAGWRSPGRTLTGDGRSTPVVWMIAHAVFGLTVGAVNAAAAL